MNLTCKDLGMDLGSFHRPRRVQRRVGSSRGQKTNEGPARESECAMNEVNTGLQLLRRFQPIVGPARVADAANLAEAIRERLDGRVVWNINSTPAGGGVAEMLQSLLPYVRGAGIDARWAVIKGTPDFFRLTKRLHHALHGARG